MSEYIVSPFSLYNQVLKVLEPGGSTGPRQGINTEQRKGTGNENCKYFESVPS